MIARLRGELVEINGTTALIDVQGVGYEVSVPENVLIRLPNLGSQVELRIRQVFREDGVSLYGFLDALERRLFDLLTDVKGCGPRIALSVIGTLGESGVIGAILQGDAKSLARANGVGQRLAERMILELKEKVAEEAAMQRIGASLSGSAASSGSGDVQLVDALLALGYRRQEAESAAQECASIEGGLSEQIKAALRVLAR